MLYRISVNIEKEYHEVVTIKNPMNMLKEALENDCRNKLEVVHDFIKVYRWSKEEVKTQTKLKSRILIKIVVLDCAIYLHRNPIGRYKTSNIQHRRCYFMGYEYKHRFSFDITATTR